MFKSNPIKEFNKNIGEYNKLNTRLIRYEEKRKKIELALKAKEDELLKCGVSAFSDIKVRTDILDQASKKGFSPAIIDSLKTKSLNWTTDNVDIEDLRNIIEARQYVLKTYTSVSLNYQDCEDEQPELKNLIGKIGDFVDTQITNTNKNKEDEYNYEN